MHYQRLLPSGLSTLEMENDGNTWRDHKYTIHTRTMSQMFLDTGDNDSGEHLPEVSSDTSSGGIEVFLFWYKQRSLNLP
jgi:hypothetical protein